MVWSWLPQMHNVDENWTFYPQLLQDPFDRLLFQKNEIPI